MPKVKISEFSATPSNNTDIDGINIAEGCAPSGINDAIRELMAQLKDFQAGTAGDSFNGPVGTSTAAAGAFTNLSASGTLGVTGVATLGNGAVLGTPASVTLTNATGLPVATGISNLGTGVATALAVNVGTAGAPVVNGGALGTPSSGTVTNLTGTASININGTVGATTASTGAFTTLSASGAVTLSGGTANGVAYLNSSKVLTTGSALTYSGSLLTNTVSDAGTALKLAGATGKVRVRPYVDSTFGVVFDSINAAENAYLPMSFYGTNIYTNPDTAAIWRVGGSEQMRLTSTGLGIGTSSPDRKLSVSMTDAAGKMALFSNGSTNTNLYLSSDPISGGAIINVSNIAASAALPLIIQRNGTETARFDSSGNFLFGTTLTDPTNGAAFRKIASGSYWINATTDTTNWTHSTFKNGNGAVGSISTAGSTTTYATSSDYRLKNITGPVTNSGAYIDSLNPVEGTWKTDGSAFVGLIAHEVQEASRTPVATGTKDGEQMQGMDYSNSELIANLIAELKSLRARVAALESN